HALASRAMVCLMRGASQYLSSKPYLSSLSKHHAVRSASLSRSYSSTVISMVSSAIVGLLQQRVDVVGERAKPCIPAGAPFSYFRKDILTQEGNLLSRVFIGTLRDSIPHLPQPLHFGAEGGVVGFKLGDAALEGFVEA